MTEQAIKKQVAREYYNVLYGAKLHLASYDICEKVPTAISMISLSFGVLGLSFSQLNSNSLASLLLIIGIIGIILKPRELQKEQYKAIGGSLTDISKKLEDVYCQIDEQDIDSVHQARTDLKIIRGDHSSVVMLSPVFLSSWYAHYKLFSEHNSDWMCSELALDWKDKIPFSLRITVVVLLAAAVLWADPLCMATKSWAWFSEPCVGCWQNISDSSQAITPTTEAIPDTKPNYGATK